MQRTLWMLLAGLLWLATGFADTVKLRDGTVLDGTITGEDNSTLTMEVEFAGGSIRQTRAVPKTDILEVKRLTAAERKQLQMEKDYHAALKHELDPARSLPPALYDQVISNTFLRYLTDYPDSPHAAEITARLREWQAERDRVAGGETKYAGQWRPAAEVTALVEKDNGQQWLQTVRQLLAQGKLEQALPYLRGVANLPTQPEMASEARALMTQAFEQALSAAERQINDLQKSADAARKRVERARQAVAAASANASAPKAGRPTKDKTGEKYQAMGSDTTALAAAQIASTKARAELLNAERELLLQEDQLAAARQKAAQLRVHARQTGIALAPPAETGTVVAAAPAVGPAPPAALPPESQNLLDQLGGIVRWLVNHWLWLLGALLIAGWLISHAMR